MSAKTSREAIATASFLVVFSALVFGRIPSDDMALVVSTVVQCIAPALAAVACRRASRRASSSGPQSLAWNLLGASALSWSLGQVVWTYYEVSSVAAPFPSVADVGFLFAVPLALAAVWTLARRSSTSTHLVAALDGFIIAGSLLSISWPLVLRPSWRAGADSTFELALSLAYPVGALVVGSSVLMAIVRAGRRGNTMPLTAIGCGLLLVGLGDSLFVWNALQGTEQEVSLADLGWTAGYLVVTLAAGGFAQAPGGETTRPAAVERDKIWRPLRYTGPSFHSPSPVLRWWCRWCCWSEAARATPSVRRSWSSRSPSSWCATS